MVSVTSFTKNIIMNDGHFLKEIVTQVAERYKREITQLPRIVLFFHYEIGILLIGERRGGYGEIAQIIIRHQWVPN